jgi:hypothetical protein
MFLIIVLLVTTTIIGITLVNINNNDLKINNIEKNINLTNTENVKSEILTYYKNNYGLYHTLNYNSYNDKTDPQYRFKFLTIRNKQYCVFTQDDLDFFQENNKMTINKYKNIFKNNCYDLNVVTDELKEKIIFLTGFLKENKINNKEEYILFNDDVKPFIHKNTYIPKANFKLIHLVKERKEIKIEKINIYTDKIIIEKINNAERIISKVNNMINMDAKALKKDGIYKSPYLIENSVKINLTSKARYEEGANKYFYLSNKVFGLINAFNYKVDGQTISDDDLDNNNFCANNFSLNSGETIRYNKFTGEPETTNTLSTFSICKYKSNKWKEILNNEEYKNKKIFKLSDHILNNNNYNKNKISLEDKAAIKVEEIIENDIEYKNLKIKTLNDFFIEKYKYKYNYKNPFFSGLSKEASNIILFDNTSSLINGINRDKKNQVEYGGLLKNVVSLPLAVDCFDMNNGEVNCKELEKVDNKVIIDYSIDYKEANPFLFSVITELKEI